LFGSQGLSKNLSEGLDDEFLFLRGIPTRFWGLTSRITFLLPATLGVLLFSLPLFSQGNFGRILGTVTDQTGGVISDATVSVIDKDRGVARTLATDAAGEYNAPTLIPGTYTVRVEAKGFKATEHQNVVLEVGKEIRVDLTVQPGEQTQSVTVTEAVPLVGTTNSHAGGHTEQRANPGPTLERPKLSVFVGAAPGCDASARRRTVDTEHQQRTPG
jgi:hypothetical protein